MAALHAARVATLPAGGAVRRAAKPPRERRDRRFCFSSLGALAALPLQWDGVGSATILTSFIASRAPCAAWSRLLGRQADALTGGVPASPAVALGPHPHSPEALNA